jgi:SAM-dependent methyltransferase
VHAAPDRDPQADELAAKIAEIRERVRSMHPSGAAGGVALPELLPILHAHDAALAKVASIGTVNPRPPGALNGAIQLVKRAAARLLRWHVRDQVEFNRAALAAVEAALEALNENNRALAELAGKLEMLSSARAALELRLASTENEILRAIAEQKLAVDFRMGQVSEEIQRRMWADLAALRTDFESVRADYERLIHTELRMIRQRASLPSAPAAAGQHTPVPIPALDSAWFAERFRGTEEYVREKQRFYVPYFQNCRAVLDLGCGRGEFLELMKEAGVPARGVELSAELVARCRAKELDVQTAELLAHLAGLPDESLDGIFAAHVVEHLPPERLPGAIRDATAKLRKGGVLAVETPDPRCLAVLATHFYLDPTHTRPVPPALLSFYMEEAGLGQIEIHMLSPAIERVPSLASLPEDFRNQFFDGLDYAMIARKL